MRDEDPPLRDEHATPWRVAVVLGAAGAAIRLVWVLAMSRPPKGLHDMTIYVAAAEGIARGRGYESILGTPTSYYPPGYPLFLGSVQWLLDRFGLDAHLVTGAGIVQALLGGVTVGAVVIAGHRLAGRRVGITAGVLVACWPNLVMHSSLMLSESLFLAAFAVLLAGLLTMTTSAPGARPLGAWVTSGLTMGLCTLIRPQSALLLVPAAALVWALARPGWAEWLRRCAVLAVGILVVVGPWTVRNAVVLDAFVPVSTNTGDNLCIGFNDRATGGFMQPPECDTGESYTDGPAAEVRRDRENRDRATTWAREHPGRLPALSWDKLFITYQNDRDALRGLESFEQDEFLSSGARRALALSADAYFFTVLLLAAIGAALAAPAAWRTRATHAAPLLLLVVTAASMVVPVAAFGEPRFKVPVAPCFALLAAMALCCAAAWLNQRRRHPEPNEVPSP